MNILAHYVDIYNRSNRNHDHSLKNENHFQSVYSSQIYGTFFSVYAKFNVDIENSDISNEKYFVDSIDFTVANYKGILDIGIQDIVSPKELMPEVNANPQIVQSNRQGTVKAFLLEMRAMGGLDESGSTQPTYDFHLPLKMEFDSDDILYFRRIKLHLHSNNNPIEKGIFDNEFFFREGPDRKHFKPRTAHSDHIRPNLRTENLDLIFNSGALCPKSENHIV